MKQYAQRGTALSLAVLLLAGSAQALFGRGKEKTEPVAPENAPAARDLEIQTYRGIPYQGRLEATAPNGDDLTYSVAAQPKKGTVMIDGADFVYTPKENALGADSFTYTAADSQGAVSQPARSILRSRESSLGQKSERIGILSRIAPSAGRNFWPWSWKPLEQRSRTLL